MEMDVEPVAESSAAAEQSPNVSPRSYTSRFSMHPAPEGPTFPGGEGRILAHSSNVWRCAGNERG